MKTQWTGKVALVTGAGGGIGKEFAVALAAVGVSVIVNDVGAELNGEPGEPGKAQSVVDEIRRAGGTAEADTHSVSDWNAAHGMVEHALDTFGRIDVVINNAGILRDRFFHNMSLEEWRQVIDVHLNGTFFVSRAAAPHFRKQGSGSFIHLTSTSGLIGNAAQANYSAAKMGVAGLSRSIAIDMARYNVRSNCIAPFAFTRMIGSIPTETLEQAERVNRLKAMEPRLVAPLAVYLASDESSGVSGQIFCVRANEIFLMGQSRPLRSVHRSEGWTTRSIAEHAIPALQANFFPLVSSADVFSWDPV